jgi:hypothetical protein
MPTGPDLSCPGLGPLAGTRIRIAGLFGGGLHATTGDGWSIHVVAPAWPNERILLSSDGDIYRGSVGTYWWHIFHSDYSELRAAGFSPSGRTLVVATSSDITLWHRAVVGPSRGWASGQVGARMIMMRRNPSATQTTDSPSDSTSEWGSTGHLS